MQSTRALLLAVLMLGSIASAATADEPAAAKLGQKIAEVKLKDADGKEVSLFDVKDRKAVVVLFLSFECPVSTSYSPVLADMAKRTTEQGVAFVGVCATEDESPASVAKHAAEFQLGFPVYHDAGGAAVAAFKAEKSPEAFVLDANSILRYRGRIDDGYAARLKKNLQINHHDLKNAIDEVVAGNPVSKPVTEAVGCPLFVERKTKRDGKVTYYRDVAPILQSRCQECHRPGQVGPFALMNYKQAVNWADDIKDYTASRAMPPWKIAEGIDFNHDRRLSDQEIATLAAWVDEGTPEGNPNDAPPERTYTDGWKLGTPDMVLDSGEDFVLGPGGRDLFRVFVMPTNLEEDKFVVAYEVRPGNPRVVHHTLNFIDGTGQGRKREEEAQKAEAGKGENDFDRGPGYSVGMGVGFFPQGALGGWAPGQRPNELPEGYGFHLPKKSDLVVQVHYHRNGRIERDRLQIGLYFAKKSEGMKAYKGGVIAGRFFAIPPVENFEVTGKTTVVEECVLHSIMPHMHLIGRQIKVTMTPPEGEKQTLLAISDWDYNWQETYFLKSPITLKPGTVMEVEAHYDNSASNPNNPNAPPRAVTFGEQTTNEMCFVFLGATSDSARRSPFGRGQERPRRRDRSDSPESETKGKAPAAD
ncbi:MAG: redoxin domain-containing protein [Planctomycetaceae bacterium]